MLLSRVKTRMREVRGARATHTLVLGLWTKMPRFSQETRSRVVLLRKKGFSVGQIRERLKEDSVVVSRRALFKLFAKYRRTGTVADLQRAARPRKLTTEHAVSVHRRGHDR